MDLGVEILWKTVIVEKSRMFTENSYEQISLKKQAIFISKNFIRMLILLFFVSIAAFALVSMAPLDPLQTNVGQAAMGSMSKSSVSAFTGAKESRR